MKKCGGEWALWRMGAMASDVMVSGHYGGLLCLVGHMVVGAMVSGCDGEWRFGEWVVR